MIHGCPNCAQGLPCGCRDYLDKPMTPLPSEVRKLLETWRKRSILARARDNAREADVIDRFADELSAALDVSCGGTPEKQAIIDLREAWAMIDFHAASVLCDVEECECMTSVAFAKGRAAAQKLAESEAHGGRDREGAAAMKHSSPDLPEAQTADKGKTK